MKLQTLTLISILTALLLSCSRIIGQELPELDKSPADIAYLRKDDKPIAKVVYSRPLRNDRVVFGKLVSYGKVWRTGANECTEIKIYQDIKLAGKEVKAGTYALFSIPGETQWTLILNTELDQWGAYGYDESKDVLRVTVPTGKSTKPIEAFTITFRENKAGGVMLLGWDTVLVEVPLEL